MAVAGRVAIVPQDEYKSTKAYKRLDMVSYNDSLYVAKVDNSGVLPTDTDTWMLIGKFAIETMTNAKNGIGRPDGVTISVDANGVFSVADMGNVSLETTAQTIKGAINELHDGLVNRLTYSSATESIIINPQYGSYDSSTESILLT